MNVLRNGEELTDRCFLETYGYMRASWRKTQLRLLQRAYTAEPHTDTTHRWNRYRLAQNRNTLLGTWLQYRMKAHDGCLPLKNGRSCTMQRGHGLILLLLLLLLLRIIYELILYNGLSPASILPRPSWVSEREVYLGSNGVWEICDQIDTLTCEADTDRNLRYQRFVTFSFGSLWLYK